MNSCTRSSCVALLDLIKAEELHSFMPSLVVMWSQHSVVKERTLHGRPMTCVLRLRCPCQTQPVPQVATVNVNDNEVDILEKFVVIMYDKSSTATCANIARLDMFARKQRPSQAIPPTRSASLQHVKRAAYHAGCIWSQSTLCQPEAQSPADWGWAKNGDLWNVVWIMFPPIVESCQQATKRGCKSECHGRCKWYRFGLSCTVLCSSRCET